MIPSHSKEASSRATSDAVSQNDSLTNFHFTFDYENGISGELYMRVGMGIFAMCVMIDLLIGLIQNVESFLSSKNSRMIQACRVTLTVSIVSKFMSVLLVYFQSFFIFKYANIVINYGKKFAVFGLMHLACTNFCVLFRTVVQETVTEISLYEESNGNYTTTTTTTTTTTANNENYNTSSNKFGCSKPTSVSNSEMSTGIQKAQERISPYLYLVYFLI